MIAFKKLLEYELLDDKNKIIKILETELESHKIQYFAKIKEWANNYYDYLMNKRNEYYSLDSKLVDASNKYRLTKDKKYLTLQQEYENKYAFLQKLYYNSKTILSKGKERFIKKEEEKAKNHYKHVIDKLADRITKKELNIDNLKIKTVHIGINIETTLTDGNKIVKAWTIEASGPIQRPHYRYLVK